MTRLTFFSNEMVFFASDASSTVEISEDDIGACIDGDDGPGSACNGNDCATCDGVSDDCVCTGYCCVADDGEYNEDDDEADGV